MRSFNNTTGDNNTANGDIALFSNTTGNHNTAIGASADVSAGNLTNATAIGLEPSSMPAIRSAWETLMSR